MPRFFYVLSITIALALLRIMIDVYYPYYHNESAWDELRYSLRSVEKHLNEDFKVWIVGDLPGWIRKETVNHIQHQRNHHIVETCTYDAASKLWLYLNAPRTSEGFVRMYDDMYFLKDVTVKDLNVLRVMHGLDMEIPTGSSVWFEQLFRTIEAVKRNGLPGYNTETHIPEFFLRDGMVYIFEKYKPIENRLLTSTLYFNTFFADKTPIIERRLNSAHFYGNDIERNYPKSANPFDVCADKTFLNHNNAGLTDALKHYIQSQFPHKSKFEK